MKLTCDTIVPISKTIGAECGKPASFVILTDGDDTVVTGVCDEHIYEEAHEALATMESDDYLIVPLPVRTPVA